jgi:hypothetical protein
LTRRRAVTVLALELVRGIGSDLFYMIGRGYDPIPQVVWIVVHTVFIVTGWMALRTGAP